MTIDFLILIDFILMVAHRETFKGVIVEYYLYNPKHLITFIAQFIHSPPQKNLRATLVIVYTNDKRAL